MCGAAESSPSITPAGGASASRAGSVDWKAFFSVLAEAGYTGAMNIENEDEFYYPAYGQGNFTEQFKRGFRVAHEFLKTLVPPSRLERVVVALPYIKPWYITRIYIVK